MEKSLFGDLQWAANQMRDGLSEIPGTTGVIICAPDIYPDQLAVVASSPSDPTGEVSKYLRDNLTGRQISVPQTAIGRMFKEGPSDHPQASESLLVPYHFVAGQTIGGLAIIQTAIDHRYTENHPDLDDFGDIFRPHNKTIYEAAQKLQDNPELIRKLELNEPSAPNAFVVMADVINSTEQVRNNYGVYRSKLNLLFNNILAIADNYDKHSAIIDGDKVKIVFWLPEDISLSNERSLAEYKKFMKESINRDLESYNILADMRVATGLGFVQQGDHNDLDGSIFYKLAAKIKSQAKQS